MRALLLGGLLSLAPAALLVWPVAVRQSPPTASARPTLPGGEESARAAHYGAELFFAVLEGLYRDGVQNEVVDRLLVIDSQTGWPANFVYACPICMPIIDALRVYRARPVFFGDKEERDTWGAGLDADWVQRLTAGERSARHAAQQQLLERWIAARMDARRLSVDDRAEWEREMELRRKQGMAQLDQYRAEGVSTLFSTMKACPSCDAANAACRLGR